MIGEIIKILPFKKSRNEGVYLRVEFKLKDGKWAKTDLVPGFRNYRRWKNLLKIGNWLSNLHLKDSQTVDADSFPHLLEGEKIKEKIKVNEELDLKKLSELGIFG